MEKHTILFLAADPRGTDRLALDREARAIQVELERSGYRDCFELETRWAAEPLDLLHELRKLKPSVVHFSGHGLLSAGAGGRAQVVSTEALERTLDAAGRTVKLVVLSACYSEAHAEAVLAHVDCVVGMSGALDDDAARSFAIGFYGGLGERESVAAAYKQGCAAISLEGLPDADRPRLKVREGVDAAELVLARSATTGAGEGGAWPLRRRILLAAAAISALLATSLTLSAGARRAACRVPGLRSLCAAVGIGDVPTPAEQALWNDALGQDGEHGLQSYLSRYPSGVYADEARARLDGCQTEETLGQEREVRIPQTMSRERATEDDARRDALASGHQEASIVCKSYEGMNLVLSARAEPSDWRCYRTLQGVTCRFDGEIVCTVRDRDKLKRCRPRGPEEPAAR